MADEAGKLMDHEYDGIQEYDNPCPGWWHMIFLASVVFSVIYFIFFHLGKLGWTPQEAHQIAVGENAKRKFAGIGDLSSDEATLLKAMNEPDWLALGEGVYRTHCQSCHGADGAKGSGGPNLTDDYYKHVKVLTDIHRVIVEGAANGTMPPWRNRLQPNDIVVVAAYVASLRGRNLAGPRGAEGEVIAPWPEETSTPPAADDTTTESAADPESDVQPAGDAE
jgi:cytochrome c oxidase cbb3-type subunit 3